MGGLCVCVVHEQAADVARILGCCLPNCYAFAGRKINADLFNKGKDRATTSSNHDLFKFIFQVITFKGLTVEVRWMPSHLQRTHLDKNLPLPEGITLEDVKANDHADLLAGDAANRHEICFNVATGHLYHNHRATNSKEDL